MYFSSVRLTTKTSYFITTPIYYVNSVPHIGHLYTSVLADAQARWQRIKNKDLQTVIFSTGTDEHGYKIQKKALAEKTDCYEFCTNISKKFRNLFDNADVKYTDYIRTTEERHKQAVEHFWTELVKKGFIYKSTYSGWYSVNDEAFLKDDEIEEKTDAKGEKIKVSKESGHVVEYTSEKNYLFKLASFKDNLRQYFDTDVIAPKNYAQSVYAQLDNLEDLSVSRDSSRINWGIRVPGDETQTIYVWLDALINYLTIAGYPNEGYAKLWPPDCQVVGKDILRFHAIYWPSFLMALDLKLPRKIICHGHWMVNNRKMSKSIGNVIDPFACISKFTSDGLRYFLLREGVPEADCNIREDKFSKFTNVELANTLGNLFQRCLPFNRELDYPSYEESESMLNESERKFLRELDSTWSECSVNYDEFNYYKGIQSIMSTLRHANNLVQEHKPWDLAKNYDKNRPTIRKMLFLVYECMRIGGILLQPIVPNISGDLLDRLNVDKKERFLEFARVNYSKQQASKKIIVKTEVLFKRL